MKSSLSIAICQLTSVDDVALNLQQIENLLSPVKPGEVELVCFPENCLYMRIKEGEDMPGFDVADPTLRRLCELAVELKTSFHLGSIPLREREKLSNASVLIDPQGFARVTYRKVHLFDIQLEGQKPIRESDVFHHGVKAESFMTHDWKIGQTICYDLRFSELFYQYALEQVDVILVPAAFLVPTGQAHWEVLLRARAIESQAYVVAAAQAGTHKSSKGQRQTYGHSLVIDPWGQIVAQGVSDQPQLLKVQLNKAEIAKVRRQIPMHDHRRLKR